MINTIFKILNSCALLVAFMSASYGQTWKVTSGTSDFDGTYKTTSIRGTGGESPYTSPLLVINKFDDQSDYNFYITGFGYAGCDNNQITIVFDAERRYESIKVTTNADKDVLFMEGFYDDQYSILFSQFIFDEMMKSKRMALRVQSDCFKRDYYFSLNGFSSAIDKVVGKEAIAFSIEILNNIYASIEFEERIFDSISEFIQPLYSEISHVHWVQKSDLSKFDLLINKIDKKPVCATLETLHLLFQITNSYKSLIDDSYTSYNVSTHLPEGISIVRIENQLCLKSDTKTIETGYFFKTTDDSLVFLLTPEQQIIEKLIDSYFGNKEYEANILFRRFRQPEFSDYIESIKLHSYDIIKAFSSLPYFYKSTNFHIVPISKTSGGLGYTYSSGTTVRRLKDDIVPFESSDDKRRRLARQEYVKDSTERWLNTPDATKPPMQFHQVSKHPTTKDCPEFGLSISHTCVENHITNHLLDRLPKEDIKKFKDFGVIVLIDGYGNIKLQDTRGLNKKRTEQIQEAFKGIIPILPARNGWGSDLKVVNVIGSFTIHL